MEESGQSERHDMEQRNQAMSVPSKTWIQKFSGFWESGRQIWNSMSTSRGDMPGGDMASTSRGDMASTSRGDMASTSRGDMASTSKSDMASTSRSDMVSTSRGNMNAHSDINVMLMGPYGHGKSSTGNSILGENEFRAIGSDGPVTKKQQNGHTQVDGRTIKVVDIPGVSNTDCTSTDDALDLVFKAMSAGLRQFPQGFHALLLVMSYTEPFTLKEEGAIKYLKLILGDNVLRDHTIIVFTHGDWFKDDFKGTKIDFKKWCTQQVDYRKLFDECGWRCVLFDNSSSCTRDEKYAQVRELIDVVDSLKNMQTNFTINKHVAPGKKRENVKRVSWHLGTYSKEIGLIKDALHKIKDLPSAERFEKIEELKLRAATLLEELSKEDHEKHTKITAEVHAISTHIHDLEGILAQQEQDKNSHSDINLMLMGKSGHGKSSTGNSILGREEFKALGGGGSITKYQQNGYTQVDGRTIKVVDIPGIHDTDCTSTDDALDLVANAMSACLAQFPQGFHALLLVLSYLGRFSKEEKKAIQSLKLILGDNVLRDHTIIVFTNGDSFKREYESSNIDFKTWCTKQVIYEELFKECGWRCVLFDNTRPLTSGENYAQVRELIDVVDSLKDMQRNFTIDKLVTAGEKREEVKRVSFLVEKYSREIGLIKDALHKMMILPSAERVKKIEELKRGAAKLLEDLSKGDHEKLTNITREVQAISAHIHDLEGLLAQQEQDKVNFTNAVAEQEEEIIGLKTTIDTLIDMARNKLDDKSKDKIYFVAKVVFNILKTVGPIIFAIVMIVI